MFKVLKFKGDEHNFFIVSDLHHSHDKDFLWGKRDCKNIIEHDEKIINSWNSVCNNNSIVFNLGDVQFGDPDGSKFLQLMRKLNFDTQWILRGNHCSGHLSIYRNELSKQFPNAVKDGILQYEVYPLTLLLDGIKKIIFLPEYVEIEINSQQIVLCHYALRSWNNMARQSMMLHGHEHGNDPRSSFENKNNGKIIDLSIENSKRPLSLIEIKRIMQQKAYIQIGHH